MTCNTRYCDTPLVIVGEHIYFPIATAPKDGTTIVVAQGDVGEWTVMWGHIQKNVLVTDSVGMWVDPHGGYTWDESQGMGPTLWRYPSDIVELAAWNLDDQEEAAILGCEEFGNGKFIYQIHRLAQKGLMSLTPVPELQMIAVYRLNAKGLSVRGLLRRRKGFADVR